MILKCVCSSFFSSPASRLVWLRFLVLSPFTHACACVKEKKKNSSPHNTSSSPREKTDIQTTKQTDDMGGGREEDARTSRNDSDSVGSSSPPGTNTNLTTNEKLQIIDARLGLLEEDVADLQTSHDVLTTLIVAAPIVLTAVLYCARLFSFAIHSSSGRKND